MTRTRMMWMGAASMAALLAGCGNDSPPARDFVGTVTTQVKTPEPVAESREPIPVEMVMAESSETAEPVPLNF